MARKFLTALDLGKNELQNAVVQNLAGAPGTPVKGQLYFDTGGNILYWYNGSGWVAAQGGAGAVPATTVTTQAVGDAAVVGVATTYAREDHKHGREAFGTITAQTAFGAASSNGAAVTLARSDHVHGTPALGTAPSTLAIGDVAAGGVATDAAKTDHKHAMPAFGVAVADTAFGSAKVDGTSVNVAHADHIHGNPVHDATAHATIPLSALAVPTAAVSLNGQKITSLGTPTTGTDAATKDYADNLTAGLSWKEAARAGLTTNRALTALTATDGVTPVANDRILLMGQTAPAENGLWLAQSGAWTRPTDYDAAGEAEGAAVFVLEGTLNGDKAFVCTTNAPITVGTTGTVWVQFGGGTAVTAGAGLVGTNTFDVVADTTITVTADQISRAALTGDVTAAAGSNATAIAANAVTNTDLADMPTNTFKGNNTGGTADPLDLTVAQMKTALGIVNKFAQATIGGATSQVVTHNLNSQAVAVEVYRTLTPWDTVDCDVERTTVNTVTLRFGVAPATNEYSCVVVG